MGRSLGRNGQDFLEQFELSPEEQSFFRWNDEKQQLIFPVYNDNNELIFYQARNFSGSGPKYLTKGNSNGIFKYFYNRGISSTNSDCSVGGDVCVVEDVVSAIKVGRFITAMPLWGSNISIERVRTLSERFKHLMIWLDKDKAEYSLKSRLMASPYFDKVTSLVTELDPKCYNNEQIKEILNV